jgi:ectoine hydroxylase-related dioxygenase (phytanoyl-CoA dioxygenase family)
MYAPPLRKGDIFFWGSRIIHGSTPGTDPSLRRRSIAAHFVPDGFKYGNLEREITVPYRERYGLRYATHIHMDTQFEIQNQLGLGPDKASRVRRWAGRRWLKSVGAGSGTEHDQENKISR